MDLSEPAVDATGAAHLLLSSPKGKRDFEPENMKGLKYVGLFLSAAVLLGTPESVAFPMNNY